MRNLILLTTLFPLLLLLNSCKTGTDDSTNDEMEVNPYIQGFTAGEISRFDPVYILFNEDIDEKKQNEEEIRKHIKISPEVAGTFSFDNSHTIVFRPREGLARETTYKVTADLSGWFPVNKKDREFSFRFSTYPLRVRAQLESMNISEDHLNSYDINFSITTVDREEESIVESLVSYSETVNQVNWQHLPDGKHHLLTLRNIPASEEGRRVLDLSVAKNKQNVPTEKLVSVSIPSIQEFTVYDVQLIVSDQTYIEVTFTQPVDSKQNMDGLVWLEEEGRSDNRSNPNILLETEGNKIKVFPSGTLSGTYDVYVSKEIKSNRGRKLNENVIRQISVSNELPGLDFIGKGVIIPGSGELIIPFKAVYLRGVVVRVVRIMEHNINQFLQVNQLDGKSQLRRVGRLVSRQVIFLDEEGKDLSHWNTYAVDLRKLIDPEPGAIYRVELSFDRDLSAYPCNEEERVTKTKEQLLAENEIAFKQEVSRYDETNQYYYYWDYDYDYDYDSDNTDPCSGSYYSNRYVARNVLATDLGIIAKRNENNEMLVLVRNIVTTEPERGVTVTIHNYQGEVIGSGVTLANGQIYIPMKGGKPFYIMAVSGRQRSYLRVDDGAALSLSSFDVAGEVIQKGIKGFIYGDRGVWRPGDTLYLSFMLNDRNNTLPANHPVVMELYNPNGQLYLKKTLTKGEMGTYAFEMPTDPDAPTGAWNVQVHVGGVTFHKRLRIETIKPNRLKINLTHDQKVLLRKYTLKSDMHVEWLTGAVAKNLKYEIEGTFTPVTTQFNGYPNFIFDDRTKTFNTEEAKFAKGTVDEKGNAKIESSFSVGSKAPGMLNLSLFTRVYEESGDFSIDGDQLLYSPYNVYAGIRSPQTTMDHLDTGKEYTFDIASVTYEGKPSPDRELEVQIYKVSWYWWWNSNNNTLANYISESHRKPVRTSTVKTGTNGQTNLKLTFNQDEWGTYYIMVKDKLSGHTTGVMSYFDWPGWAGRRDTERGSNANILSFNTDKKNYNVGEKIRLTIPSAAGSRAVVSVENGSRVVSVTDHNGQAGETVIELPATEEMMPNAFLHVTLLQPHANTQNDAPIRMYGVMPVEVTSPESHLRPEIRTADEIRPEEKYEVTVSEKDGREMSYTLAIVDEGLLDLTRFRTPDPWQFFNAREALGITTWDLYNYIVGAYGGRIEQVFSIGGDDALGSGRKAVVNRFKPVVEFAGPFYLKKGEKKRHTFTMPNYNGRVRVMVVAGDGAAYGHTEKSVMVRKPLMLLGTLPRIIGTSE
ncbi:MAG: MG2 domain-containing protein, partial [Tannerellaceae bacterium]|nr:MG2 domain-containing protein [Tannerellaceae bacterium]